MICNHLLKIGCGDVTTNQGDLRMIFSKPLRLWALPNHARHIWLRFVTGRFQREFSCCLCCLLDVALKWFLSEGWQCSFHSVGRAVVFLLGRWRLSHIFNSPGAILFLSKSHCIHSLLLSWFWSCNILSFATHKHSLIFFKWNGRSSRLHTTWLRIHSFFGA